MRSSILKHVFLFTTILLFSFEAAAGQVAPVAEQIDADRARVESDLRFLAADELMGRYTGRTGNNVAARYIAEQFRQAGLQQLDGAPGYFQRIPMGSATFPSGGVIVIGIDTLRAPSDFVLLEGDGMHTALPVTFVGHGIHAPELGYNDFDGLDVDGMIVVARYGFPAERQELAGAALSESKRRAAAQHGAAALIEFYEGEHRGRELPWATLLNVLTQQRFRIFPEGKVLSHFWINDADGMWRRLAEGGGLANLAISTGGIERHPIRAQNVVGWLPGSDPDRRDEYVVLLAHYDHVGTIDQVYTYEPDSIYNGARDNAMGVTALLEAARNLSMDPPARSTIFLAVTAEEVGMIGSGYYVENPLVPLEQTVYALNTDGAGFTDTTIVTVVGLERTTAREAIESGAALAGLEAIPDPVPEQNLFDRSDNARFTRKGVPAPTFSPGFREFGEALMRTYHQPADEVDDTFDFHYLLRFSRAYTEAARNIANMPERPYWVDGDPYQQIGDVLYGYQ